MILLFISFMLTAGAEEFCYGGLERFTEALRTAETKAVRGRLASADHPTSRPEMVVKEGTLNLTIDHLYVELPFGMKKLVFERPAENSFCIINESLPAFMQRQSALVDARYSEALSALTSLRERLHLAQRLCPWARRIPEAAATGRKREYVESGLRELGSSIAEVSTQLANLEGQLSQHVMALDPEDRRSAEDIRAELQKICAAGP